MSIFLKYFSSFTAVKIGKKRVQAIICLTIDQKYIDFDTLCPPGFEFFWRNKTETKDVHM